jgi:hypothetical protein
MATKNTIWDVSTVKIIFESLSFADWLWQHLAFLHRLLFSRLNALTSV